MADEALRPIVMRALPTAAGELMLQLFGAKALPAALGSSPLLRYPVPVKDRAVEQAWALNWVDFIDPPEVARGLEHVIEPKKTSTKAFVDHVAALPRLEGSLGPEMAPAKRVRVQFSQRVFRLKFLDENGCGVDPPGFSFQLTNVALAIGPPSVKGTG